MSDVKHNAMTAPRPADDEAETSMLAAPLPSSSFYTSVPSQREETRFFFSHTLSYSVPSIE